MIIGLMGEENSGRKTFVKCLEEILPHLIFNLFSPFDEAKIELNKFLQENIGISCYEKDEEKFKIIKPIIKNYYDAKNFVTKHKYWTQILDDKIKSNESLYSIPIIIDLNDYEWNIISKNGGKIIKIEKIPSFKEIPSFPYNYLLRWSSSNDMNYLKDTILLQLKDFIKELCPNYQV